MSREYLDFDVAIDKTATGYAVRVVDSPAGPASAPFVLPFGATDLAQFMIAVGPPRLPSRRLVPAAERVQGVRDYGQRLHDALFSGEVGAAFTRSLDQASAGGKSLRIRLRLAAVPELDPVPWEYLYSSNLVRFVTLSDDTPIVRYLDARTHLPAVSVEPPLRVLAMVSSPTDMPILEVQREIDLLRATTADLVSNGLLIVDVLDRAMLSSLQRALLDSYHVFHFIGHGGFDDAAGEGVLVLEREDGKAHRVSGSRVGTLLHDAQDLQLAVLNSCEGARTSGRDSFSGVAQALVQQGLPAVVAMQTEISDRAALAFSHEFYYFLSRGLPIETAMCEVRKAMATSDEASEWGTAVLLRSGASQPFQFKTTKPVSQPAREERWESLYQAAGNALATGAEGTAIPILEQLVAENAGYQNATQLLQRVRPAVPGDVPPSEPGPAPANEPGNVPPSGGSDVPPSGGGEAGPDGGAGSTATQELPRPLMKGGDPAYGQGGAGPAGQEGTGTSLEQGPVPTPGAGDGRVTEVGPEPQPRPRWALIGAGALLVVAIAGGVWYALTRSEPPPPPPDRAAVERVCGPAAAIPKVRDALVIGCAVDTPIIDGRFDDWGSQARTTADAVVFTNLKGANEGDFSSDWQGAWDRDALYVKARVTDGNRQFVDNPPDQYWKGDSISFEFGPDPRELSTDDPLRVGQDRHVIIGLVGENQALADVNPATGNVIGKGRLQRAIAVEAATSDDGYEIEARVPWSVLGVDTPHRGDVFAVNLNVSDAAPTDAWALGRMISSNPARTRDNQKHPGTWQRLVLADEPEVAR